MIRQILVESNLALTDRVIAQFEDYAAFLIEWNEKMNLTAITEPRQIAIKHFLDSLLLFSAYEVPQAAKVIDVGTGAGFPGVPLKIARSDIALTLLDSLQKRLCFLHALTSQLGLEVDLVHSRAEDAAKKDLLREKFDVAVSRAVAPLNVLLEYCLPFVKVGGVFVALKGSRAQEEINAAKNALRVLKGEIVKVENFKLEAEARNIIVIRKAEEVDFLYPRSSAKIKRKPL